MDFINQWKSENDREASWMFCHGASEAAVHPGCGVYARAYSGNHGSFFFQGNGLRRREHRLFFNALPKECRSKDRAKGAHGQWSCQELFSPSVQGFQILGGGGLRYPIRSMSPDRRPRPGSAWRGGMGGEERQWGWGMLPPGVSAQARPLPVGWQGLGKGAAQGSPRLAAILSYFLLVYGTRGCYNEI